MISGSKDSSVIFNHRGNLIQIVLTISGNHFNHTGYLYQLYIVKNPQKVLPYYVNGPFF